MGSTVEKTETMAITTPVAGEGEPLPARPAGKRRARKRTSEAPSGPVTVLKVDPRVRAEVDRIVARGRYTRPRVVTDPEAFDGVAVIVR